MRRVAGDSMQPTLPAGRLVVAVPFGVLKIGDIIIVEHRGLEKIKRIAMVDDDHIFIVGDNPAHSTDSRSFGWLHYSAVSGKVVWPRQARRRSLF